MISYKDFLKIESFGKSLGFQDISITKGDTKSYHKFYQSWLDNNFQGTMDYLTRNREKREIPSLLVEDTKSVIVVTHPYLTNKIDDINFKNIKKDLQKSSNIANISLYSLGRDYHKVLKKKLKRLGNFITEIHSNHKFRPFTDSAPILEKPLAEIAKIGWQGKHSNILNMNGSFFFLGVIYSNLEFESSILEHKKEIKNLCGKCQACIKVCPTDAIIFDKIVDAKKCISYLTIENKKEIPLKYRKKIGNRVYGCDDCQLVCPFNRFTNKTDEKDFYPRDMFYKKSLTELFCLSEKEFLKYTEGSAMRRISYQSFLRNISIGLGNAPFSEKIIKVLEERIKEFKENALLLEHFTWALKEQKQKN